MTIEHLVLNVESSAAWRAGKAAQYPDDKRNPRSSSALSKLAENLKGLSSTDEFGLAYEEVMERAIKYDDVLYRISEIEQRYISRYGFDYPQDGNPGPFLEGLTGEIVEIVETEEERVAEGETEAKYEAAKETADEAAKEAAHEAATEAAEEAAKEAAEEAYKEAYEETYREVYEETYKQALLQALQE